MSLQRFLNSAKPVEKICVNLLDSPLAGSGFHFLLDKREKCWKGPRGWGKMKQLKKLEKARRRAPNLCTAFYAMLSSVSSVSIAWLRGNRNDCFAGYMGLCRCEGFSSSLIWDRVYKPESLGLE